MRLGFYLLLVLFAALIDHALLSLWWWTPDLSLALAAWAMVDGSEEGVVWRAWVAGLARDLIDPAGWGFHLLAFTALGAALLPLRRFLFRARAAAWAVWAFVSYVLVSVADGLLTGFGELTPTHLLIGAATTALASVACGWLFGGLPARFRPVAAGGA